MSPWPSAPAAAHLLHSSTCGTNSSETLKALPVDKPPFADLLLCSNRSLSTEMDVGEDGNTTIPGHGWTAAGGDGNQMNAIASIAYALICVIGLAGNGLVVFVIARYANMKTVTNLYILNLSIADGVFLLGLPLLLTTLLAKRWLLGLIVCKVYYVMTCVNAFTGSFTLTVMSADRYLAICHPITAISIRTPRNALIVIGALWVVSFLPMVPIILYAGLVEHAPHLDRYTCTVDWPTAHVIAASHAFVIYNLVLGFLAPVAGICVFYGLLVLRLRGTRPAAQSSAAGRNGRAARRHPKVTRLVTLIIAVYIVCWLPYWAFQIHLISDHPTIGSGYWKLYLYHVLTLLSYANSMINPFLYAFTNHNFRESFTAALGCRCGSRKGEAAAVYEMTSPDERPRGRKQDSRRFLITGCSKTVASEI